VFDSLNLSKSLQRYKHGLYPNWLYECVDPRDTVHIERHVAFFAASRDKRQYERLKSGLALYRLVFGQPNQEDLLNELEASLEALGSDARQEAMRRLAGYMINLSPIDGARARRFADEEADGLLGDRDGVRELLDDVRRLCKAHSNELRAAQKDLEQLIEDVEAANDNGRISSRHRPSIAALVYLRNPYDQRFDMHVDGGFEDDVAVIRDAVLRRR
jgi:hypothetical protein